MFHKPMVKKNLFVSFMFLADGSQDTHAEGVSYELCDVSRVGFLKQLSAMIFYGVGRYTLFPQHYNLIFFIST